MRVIKPPNDIPNSGNLLFLAGSIEMGVAEDWQARVERLLADTDWTILNPRRDDWDSSWVQSKDNPQFREQVEWELDGLLCADRILLYLAPGTQSPISLLELGLFHGSRMLVVCPDGFWRKGNVDIVCEWTDTPQAATLEDAAAILRPVNPAGKGSDEQD